MEKTKAVLRRVWKVVRWILLIAVVLFVVDYAVGTWALRQQHQYALQLQEKFKTDHITLVDVMGGRLPPEPDPTINNSTLEGVDANHNGIRDDVELAIFKLHPDSARIRAAELQYAKALQYEFDGGVYTPETWDAVVRWSQNPAVDCVVTTTFTVGTTTRERIRLGDVFEKEVRDEVFNTLLRKDADVFFNKLERAGAYLDKWSCDIDPATLPN